MTRPTRILVPHQAAALSNPDEPMPRLEEARTPPTFVRTFRDSSHAVGAAPGAATPAPDRSPQDHRFSIFGTDTTASHPILPTPTMDESREEAAEGVARTAVVPFDISFRDAPDRPPLAATYRRDHTADLAINLSQGRYFSPAQLGVSDSKILGKIRINKKQKNDPSILDIIKEAIFIDREEFAKVLKNEVVRREERDGIIPPKDQSRLHRVIKDDIINTLRSDEIREIVGEKINVANIEWHFPAPAGPLIPPGTSATATTGARITTSGRSR